MIALPKIKKDRRHERPSNAARMRLYRSSDPERYKKEHLVYKKGNPNKFRSYDRARYARLRKFLQTSKEVPCADCGVELPHYCMEFDHCRGEKLFNVSHIGTGIARIKAEMAKCDVVCAVCHKIRTWNRSNPCD